MAKQKSDAGAAPLVPAWHPNFRNYEKLPDIKVVRTAFFINGAAIFIAVGLVLYFGFQEWQLHVLNAQVADWQRQVDRDKSGSDKALALYKKFQTEEAKILEVEAFVKSKPVVSDLLVRLSQTLPNNIALDSFDLRENGLNLRITVRGAPDVAPNYASAYLEQLRADKQLARFDQGNFTAGPPQRNTSNGRLTVEFVLPLKPAIVKEAKKP